MYGRTNSIALAAHFKRRRVKWTIPSLKLLSIWPWRYNNFPAIGQWVSIRKLRKPNFGKFLPIKMSSQSFLVCVWKCRRLEAVNVKLKWLLHHLFRLWRLLQSFTETFCFLFCYCILLKFWTKNSSCCFNRRKSYVSKYSHLSNTYVAKEVEINVEGVQMSGPSECLKFWVCQ